MKEIKVEAKNIDDLKELLEKAKEQAEQLQRTLKEIEEFDFKVQVS